MSSLSPNYNSAIKISNELGPNGGDYLVSKELIGLPADPSTGSGDVIPFPSIADVPVVASTIVKLQVVGTPNITSMTWGPP